MRYLTICILALASVSMPVLAEPSSERALAIMREIDDMWRGESSHGVFTMKIKTQHYTRKMTMEGWSRGKDKSLVRITYPLKEKGTTTLMSGSSIYMYLPKTDRTIRLTSGMMGGSWMGSHFTNDDLVKESRLTEDYDITISFEGVKDGQKILEFSLIPKPDAAVVWGKIVFTIRAEDHIPVSAIYFDEDMSVARTETFAKVKNLGGRTIPSVIKIVPADKPEEFTELVYEKMEFDLKLPDAFFSIATIRKR